MPIRKPKPTSPGRRFVSYADYAEITKTEPEKSLVEGLKKSGGRNANGRKTARHRGGGAKRLYRRIDFKRTRDNIPAKVAAIEYDPNRSAYIALLHYADGEKSYILAPNRLRVGMTVQSGAGSDITVGKYTFRVHPDAHKTQIKQAVEQLFGVTVLEVRTSKVPSKPKRRGYTSGRTRAWKKAIVQVREGDSIPIFQGLEADL